MMLACWLWSEEQIVRGWLRVAIGTALIIGAILALLALLNAALVVAAIYIWKTASHPGPFFVQKAGSGIMDPVMRKAFWGSFSAFTLLFLSLLVARFRVEKAVSGAMDNAN